MGDISSNGLSVSFKADYLKLELDVLGQGLLTSVTLTFWARYYNSLLLGAVLCVVECLAFSGFTILWVSTH